MNPSDEIACSACTCCSALLCRLATDQGITCMAVMGASWDDPAYPFTSVHDDHSCLCTGDDGTTSAYPLTGTRDEEECRRDPRVRLVVEAMGGGVSNTFRGQVDGSVTQVQGDIHGGLWI